MGNSFGVSWLQPILCLLLGVVPALLDPPDNPKFLEGNVNRIQEGWDDTKKKAQDRLKLIQDTKEAWVGYADNNETIAQQFEVAEEEIKMVKKRYNLEDALSD